MTLSKPKIALIGCGGHARSITPLLLDLGYEVEGIYDNSFQEGIKETIAGVNLKGGWEQIPFEIALLIAFGDPQKRAEFYQKYPNQWAENVIHPKTVLGMDVSMGKSNQILAGTILNSFVEVGNNNLINTGAILEHETQIGNHNHISVGAILCGRVKMGDRNMIGAGTVIKDGVKIASDIVIGAGSVVVRDLLEPGTYVGTPVRKIK